MASLTAEISTLDGDKRELAARLATAEDQARKKAVEAVQARVALRELDPPGDLVVSAPCLLRGHSDRRAELKVYRFGVFEFGDQRFFVEEIANVITFPDDSHAGEDDILLSVAFSSGRKTMDFVFGKMKTRIAVHAAMSRLLRKDRLADLPALPDSSGASSSSPAQAARLGKQNAEGAAALNEKVAALTARVASLADALAAAERDKQRLLDAQRVAVKPEPAVVSALTDRALRAEQDLAAANQVKEQSLRNLTKLTKEFADTKRGLEEQLREAQKRVAAATCDACEEWKEAAQRIGVQLLQAGAELMNKANSKQEARVKK